MESEVEFVFNWLKPVVVTLNVTYPVSVEHQAAEQSVPLADLSSTIQPSIKNKNNF